MTETTDVGRVAWLEVPERGTVRGIRLLVWVALRVGRRAACVLLLPIVLYFVGAAPRARAASRAYLARVLGRPPGLGDVFRHFHTFAVCALDRVFLLNDRLAEFELTVHGEEVMTALLASGTGCLLMGAHFGSFEAVRALGRRHPGVRVTLAMYEENARKVGSVIAAINPRLALDVVALGQSGAMLGLKQRLDDGHFVGLLADRGLDERSMVRNAFLGAEAAFPIGPFRMAELLRAPVVLIFGVFRGGRRYDVYFERLCSTEEPPGSVPAEEMLSRYAARLAERARDAPYNWFNFFEFWR